MADEIGTKVSQLPLGENLADSDLMYAVEDGISKKVEVGYLKNRLVGGVDSAPTQGSSNLVQSGGVYTAISGKADASAIPTDLVDLAEDSTHRTVTDAEKNIWNGKQNALTFDDAPMDSSNNPVKSGGIYTTFSKEKENIFQITGNKILPVLEKNAVANSGSSVSMSEGYPVTTSDNSYDCNIIPCSTGDVFTLFCSGGIPYRAYSFINSNGDILAKSAENSTLEGFEVVAPANSAFIIINNKRTNVHDNYSGSLFQKIVKSANEMKMLHAYINDFNKFKNDSNLFGVGEFSNGNYYPTSRPYRCCTKKVCSFDVDITIKAASGYRFYPHVLENGSWVGKNWQTTYMISAGTSFGIVFAKTTEVTSHTANVGEFLDRYLVLTKFAIDNININTMGSGIRSINHRGYNTEAPENTLPAFKLSKEKGFAWVETDVNVTQDGVLVLLHDSTINRTARNADGTELSSTINITSISYDDLLEYDFGLYNSSFGNKYKGTKIPTLEQFFTLCKRLGLNAYVEIKIDGAHAAYIKDCVDMAKKCGMIDRVVWICDTLSRLSYLLQFDTNAKVGHIVNTIDSTVISNLMAIKTSNNYVFVDAKINNINDTVIGLCVEAGLPVETWTVDTQSTVENLNPYISGLTTNLLLANVIQYEANIML